METNWSIQFMRYILSKPNKENNEAGYTYGSDVAFVCTQATSSASHAGIMEYLAEVQRIDCICKIHISVGKPYQSQSPAPR